MFGIIIIYQMVSNVLYLLLFTNRSNRTTQVQSVLFWSVGLSLCPHLSFMSHSRIIYGSKKQKKLYWDKFLKIDFIEGVVKKILFNCSNLLIFKIIWVRFFTWLGSNKYEMKIDYTTTGILHSHNLMLLKAHCFVCSQEIKTFSVVLFASNLKTHITWL